MHPKLLRGPRGTLIPSLMSKSNKLAESLKHNIRVDGPMPVANFME